MIGVSGLAYKGSAGYAGCKQRKSDDPPGHGSSCKKIRAGITAFSVAKPPPGDEHQVEADYYDIYNTD